MLVCVMATVTNTTFFGRHLPEDRIDTVSSNDARIRPWAPALGAGLLPQVGLQYCRSPHPPGANFAPSRDRKEREAPGRAPVAVLASGSGGQGRSAPKARLTHGPGPSVPPLPRAAAPSRPPPGARHRAGGPWAGPGTAPCGRGRTSHIPRNAASGGGCRWTSLPITSLPNFGSGGFCARDFPEVRGPGPQSPLPDPHLLGDPPPGEPQLPPPQGLGEELGGERPGAARSGGPRHGRRSSVATPWPGFRPTCRSTRARRSWADANGPDQSPFPQVPHRQ